MRAAEPILGACALAALLASVDCGSGAPPDAGCASAAPPEAGVLEGGNDGGADGSGGPTGVVVSISTPQADCPRILGISAFPYDIPAGASARVTASVSPSDAGSPTFEWTGESGTFADATMAATTFVCTAPGEVLLTFSVTLGACHEALTVPVRCAG